MSTATAMQRVLLALTNFKSPILRAVVPCGVAAVALQALAAAPSVAARSELFFDVSGSLTYLAVGALSLYLPALRARALAAAQGAAALPKVPSIAQLAASAWRGHADTVTGGRNWRQLVLVGLTMVWATRLGTYLFSRVLSSGHDSRFDKIRDKPLRFASVFLVQAVWVTIPMLPVVALAAVPAAALPAGLAVTDVLGLSLWGVGMFFEAVADYQKSQWAKQKKRKEHDEDFLTSGLFSVSRFPHYFGEISMWTGIAATAAGVLARAPAQRALGWTSPGGIVATTALCGLSPLFSWFVVTKLSGVPMSESKYDERYGHRKDYQKWRSETPRLVPKLW
ncbi:membrane protein, putative [Cordyceps militaris]|uniref:Membrane protein, putative n=1 Tax=Cordyceps militaris TaxID=73501 RepID=A0A2H4SSG2_CORMI|nr:membrane protein, putative [Cordyceps militaris]